MISAAEESTAWPGVSRPTYLGGLGFGFKWNMGWMHDTLGYFQQDPIYRRWHHHELTFSLVYAFTENFILPLSHDEVVHGKGSLLDKMPGDTLAEAAPTCARCTRTCGRTPARSCCSWARSSRRRRSGAHERSLDWHLLEQPEHAGVQSLVRDLNRVYKAEPALWEIDFDGRGFWWIEPNDADDNVFAFARRTKDPSAVVVVRVQPLAGRRAHGYRIGLPRGGRWLEALNTDPAYYGGTDTGQPRRRRRRAGRLARPAVLGRGHAAAARRRLARAWRRGRRLGLLLRELEQLAVLALKL